MKDIFRDKKVLFITTKNIDYIRNSQEIDIIKSNAKSYDVIGSTKKGYLQRLLEVYLSILFTSFKKYDVIFIGFAPQLIIPFWRWKLRKSIVVIDFFISMYDTLIFDRKKFNEDSYIAKILYNLDKKTINYADKVICDTKAHGEFFCEEFGLEKDKLIVLYLNADKSIYYNRDINKPKELEDKYIVLYFGSILPLPGVEIVLESINLLKDNDKIHFYIIGPIDKNYCKPETGNVTYFSWLSQEELAKYISYSDLCLAGHFNSEIMKAKRTIPGKAYIYRAMNKPMILGDNLATHELYNEGDEGVYFVKMGDAKALAEKITQIWRNSNEINNTNTLL